MEPRVAILVDKVPSQFGIGNTHRVFPIRSGTAQNVNKYNPDAVFIFSKASTEYVRPAIEGRTSAYYFVDFRPTVPFYVKEFCSITSMAIFAFRRKDYFKLSRDRESHFAWLGTNPDLFFRIPEVMKDHDVVFGGNYYNCRKRSEVIRFLKKHYRVLVVGRNWGKARIECTGRKNLIEMNRQFNRAYVSIGIHNMDMDYEALGVSCATSNRLFQNMAMGIPHIAPYAPGVASQFSDGYMDYRSLSELKEKIDWLLGMSQADRDKIGDNQRMQIVENHTHAHSWSRIESFLRCPGMPRPGHKPTNNKGETT